MPAVPSARAARLLALILGLGAICLSGWLLSKVWIFTVDDSFITFRYARNLAAGAGLTYNPGERIEGCTSFLWVLVTAVPELIAADVERYAKWVGVLALAGCAALMVRWVSAAAEFLPAGERLVPAAATVLLLAAFGPSAVHAVSGMETALDALLITALLRQCFQLVQGPGSGRALGLLALLAGLTRPEGNLVAAVAAAATLALLPSGRRGSLARQLALWYLLPAAAYFAARALYFGLLLPLPFYLKVGHASELPGLPEVRQFLLTLGSGLGVLLVLGLRRGGRAFLPALLAVVTFLVFFVFPKHVMGYQWRFLFPITPTLMVLAGMGLATLQVALRRHSPITALATVTVVTLTLGYFLLRPSLGGIAGQIAYAHGLQSAHVPLGRQIAALEVDRPDPLLAIADAGATPYYSDWRTLDTYGLNDVTIARSGKHEVTYVLDQEPDLLVLISRARQEFLPRLQYEQRLYRAAQQRGLRHLATFPFDARYFLWVLAHPDTAIGRQVAAW